MLLYQCVVRVFCNVNQDGGQLQTTYMARSEKCKKQNNTNLQQCGSLESNGGSFISGFTFYHGFFKRCDVRCHYRSVVEPRELKYIFGCTSLHSRRQCQTSLLVFKCSHDLRLSYLLQEFSHAIHCLLLQYSLPGVSPTTLALV